MNHCPFQTRALLHHKCGDTEVVLNLRLSTPTRANPQLSVVHQARQHLKTQSSSSLRRRKYQGPTILGRIPQLVSELKLECRGQRVRSLWEERDEVLLEAARCDVPRVVLCEVREANDVGDGHKDKRLTVTKGST